MDPRYEILSRLVINHSVRLQSGENILLETTDIPSVMIECLIEAAARVGGHPVSILRDSRVSRAIQLRATREQMKLIGEWELSLMERVQAYISFRAFHNINELGDVSAEQRKFFDEYISKKVHLECRIPKTKWCVLRWPTSAMAQLFEMSTSAFEDFYFRACLVDYARMEKPAEKLRQRMLTANRVRIVGPDETDLRFSIKDIGAVACYGRRNVPDGEVFSAPIKDSVEGVIVFNTPTTERSGKKFSNIRLVFRNGNIVVASCETGSQKDLTDILNKDEGSRRLGEFALAFNPVILKPMGETLFDEKVAGSLHLAIGSAYKEAWNDNESVVHWDSVLVQRPEYGGGEVWFDNELIRKDGIFVPEYLRDLNTDRLLT